MSNDRGVFRLGAYRRAQVEGQGVNLNDVWLPLEISNYGYMGGGVNSPDTNSTALDKITFDTDTVARTPSTDLLETITNAGTFTSSSAGYLVAGYTGSPANDTAVSTVRKLTYATEVFSTASPGYGPGPAPPGGGAWGLMGAASPTNGYIAGGRVGPSLTPGANNRTRRMSFASETWDTFGATMTSQFLNIGDVIGNQDAGYWCGGLAGGLSRMHKLTYSTETASTAGNLPVTPSGGSRYNSAGVSNATQGYLATGSATPGPSNTSKIQKVTFATDTAVHIPSRFPVSVSNAHGTGNISNGYIGGGSGFYSSVWKFDMSTETVSTLSSSLSTAAYGKFAVSVTDKATKANTEKERWTDGFKEDDLKKGYYSGGSSNGYSTVTQKVDYATDQTSIVPGGYLPDGSGQFAGANSNSVRTIMSGGEPSGNPFMQFVYATETASNISGSMPGKRIRNNDMGYGTETAGYVTGGEKEPSSPAAYYSSTQKIEFTTDTASEVPGANSGWTMRYAGGFGNVDHTLGYVVGGQTFPGGPAISRIQKMTYSTETMANTPANMQNGYFNLGTTSGPDAGYIYSKQEYPGWTSNGAIEKFVYATDSRTTVPQPSYYPRYGANGTGNSTNGYYGGGAGAPSPSYDYRRILKLNFSTGVGQDLPSSQFPYNEGVYRSAAGSAVSRKKSPIGAPEATPTPTTVNVPNPSLSTEGYWSGGYAGAGTPGVRSITDRLTFATDTTSRLPGSNCPARKHWASGSSSATKGYSNGGYEGWESPRTSNIYSLTYASGTWATAATLGDSRGKTASINNLLYSWTGGGGNSDPVTFTSKIDRLTFATETPSKNILQSAYSFQWATGIGNNLAGYFCNHKIDSQSGTTLVEKLTYSTDSIALTPGLHVSGTTSLGARVNSTMAIGTGDIGYIMGGRSPNRSTVNKITFATDTRTVGEPLWAAVQNGSGLSSPSAGYLSGTNPGTNSDAYKMPFASETWTYTGPANASPSSGQQKTGFGAGMNGNAFPEITPVL